MHSLLSSLLLRTRSTNTDIVTIHKSPEMYKPIDVVLYKTYPTNYRHVVVSLLHAMEIQHTIDNQESEYYAMENPL